ncbi:GNAT family N-acetyltransferase [Actinacidiphila sp. DG2A-62]|uniref:GNAT family N-acetyltransferase n=1 Tax=Actinacidiphila sp. DG2A-62 TaxID=3108821 RepID=UPI002DBABA7C|nr:GNAT family N-acetyltransferase [Actinacidiphila sp. DG2A-62]MEC3993020.1 GNAT family N-acetyltransferase [Actinacidiphila sp. DG2A-62]
MTATFPDITLSTDRLVLRPYDEADLPALTEMMNDDLVTAWTGAPHPYTAEDARLFVTTTAPAERTEGRGLVLAVTEFLTQRLVGTVTLQRTDWRIRGTEIGYLTAAWARGEGYASESVLAVCRWLFREQGFQRVELRTAADNTASQQVAQKIGCVSEGVLRGAGLVRTRPEHSGRDAADRAHRADGAGPADAGWVETRTDLLVWSLLPEDLDDASAPDGDEEPYESYASSYPDPADPSDRTAYAHWR